MIARNLPELFINRVNENKNKIAFRYRLRRNDPYKSISWEHLSTLVQEIVYGLVELGLKKGDNVAIISQTRYEWAVCDLAILSCGGVVVPIYPTLGEQPINYILNNSDCRIVILEDKGQLQKIRSQWTNLPKVEHAIVIEDLGDLPQHESRIFSLKILRDKGRLNFAKDPDLFERHIGEIDIGDIATIIYTSGTTGLPKGVVLTHKNILSVLSALPFKLSLRPSDSFLSFLPLSHVFERVGGLYYAISIGITVTYCTSVDQIGIALKDSKATLMLVVPRLLEKMHTKIRAQIETLPELKRKIFNWAYYVGSKKLEAKSQKSRSISYFYYSFLHSLAYLIVFSKIKKTVAPNLRFFISGGAPLSKEIAEFFWIVGLPVLEGYGLTETSAPATVNSVNEYKIGTVGKPLPNVELKIANDGEILIKGPNVFLQYYKNEKSTQEVFIDGWFKSGDIGIIDEDGFLKITDRKKDIIVNSAGKNIAPQNIENLLKSSPYINNAVVIGDKKKYLSALITLEHPSIDDFAKSVGVHYDGDINKLCNHPEIVKLIDEEIKLKTTQLADYEQIRKFTILANDFTVETGEMTPTLKVKRRFVQEKYKIIIDSMYPRE